VCDTVAARHQRGRYASIVVVAEGALPVPGTLDVPEYGTDHIGRPRLGGISVQVAREIERRTGFEARVVQIGHVQRGGTPTAFDRVLSTRFGVEAMRAVRAGERDCMVALRGTEVVTVPLSVTDAPPRGVDRSLYDDVARVFFG